MANNALSCENAATMQYGKQIDVASQYVYAAYGGMSFAWQISKACCKAFNFTAILGLL